MWRPKGLVAAAAAPLPPLPCYSVDVVPRDRRGVCVAGRLATLGTAADTSTDGGVTGLRFWARLRRGPWVGSHATQDGFVSVDDTVPLGAGDDDVALRFRMTLLEADSIAEALPSFETEDGVGGLWLLAPDAGDGARSLRAGGDAALASSSRAPPLFLTLVRADEDEFERCVRDVTVNPLRADAYAAAEARVPNSSRGKT
jgi:hypothetical protein